METVKMLDLGFSTADAEYPEIHQEEGDLRAEFKDWQEKTVKLYFADYVACKWEMVFDLLEGERDDSCYEICSSLWLKQHVQSEIINCDEGYKHFRLNFNELGQLDVIALNIVVRT
ncbi:hypothetical protein ACXWHK_003109 [Vibrio alginolyticus]|uniref:hypothetical protein n=1 Tax=Vibrio TaxID=662 RepID=UPI001BD30906|nr:MULTISPECIES: hypothetical protein [Vibrio]EGQ8448700.1 hypothetical protein [Vibrio alginolyticus]EGQ9716302.1 hypothetical protein [Vibrio alginolyticus]EGR0197535.1 hypothetical protein [Vibrio alginolyticus]EGR2552187.1 hypothetical protein [Vibrio alginolyticus]EHK9548839.1 hypothetical protein [Vibrio alginolyticus]